LRGVTVILPEAVVARQAVLRNRGFRFRSPAGRYIVVARYNMPSNVRPFVRVSVAPRKTARANIADVCM
jgi:hypothetical protein